MLNPATIVLQHWEGYSDQERGLDGLWYLLDGIANIRSMNNVQKKYKVTYNSSQKTGSVVHKADGTNYEFMPSKGGYSSLMLRAV